MNVPLGSSSFITLAIPLWRHWPESHLKLPLSALCNLSLPWEHLPYNRPRPGTTKLPHSFSFSPQPLPHTHSIANLSAGWLGRCPSSPAKFSSLFFSNPAVLLLSNENRNHFRKEASWFISLTKLKQWDLSTVHMMNRVSSPWPQWVLQWLWISGLSHPSHLQNHVGQRERTRLYSKMISGLSVSQWLHLPSLAQCTPSRLYKICQAPLVCWKDPVF
jgi:hypothetical protein